MVTGVYNDNIIVLRSALFQWSEAIEAVRFEMTGGSEVDSYEKVLFCHM